MGLIETYLLGPEDAVTLYDIEALVKDVTSDSYKDKGFNACLHEVWKIVDEFQIQKFNTSGSRSLCGYVLQRVVVTTIHQDECGHNGSYLRPSSLLPHRRYP